MVKRAVTLAMAVAGMMLIPVPTQALAQLSPMAEPSAFARADIPPPYLTLYTRAARTCPGLPWQVLAAIGSIESDHGRSGAPNVHGPSGHGGAEGPMQFEPATFAAYSVRADRAHPVSPYNPADAIYTAARLLCAAGAAGGSPSGLRQAIYAYNHAGWYVNAVLNLAARYSGPAARPKPVTRPAPVVRPWPTTPPTVRPTVRPTVPGPGPVRSAPTGRPVPTGSAKPASPAQPYPPMHPAPAQPLQITREGAGLGTPGTPSMGTASPTMSPATSLSGAPNLSPAAAATPSAGGAPASPLADVLPTADASGSMSPRAPQSPSAP